ncbi:asparagine synthase (glutamine-hydrolyzing) [Actinopolymorpha rutila]|uniref:asparagine synthase (glutamine-hydrolyzing) n=1 Tax=Actinopolymorpha rutila TaxID=446787 RepID=A0A852ZQR7_9ACTN|nr:asparagine synthase (glutamine-hydrolyzing) [Actinopolymorpha rutila]NYH90886.1 asparagine synthase (glutamine-hydrolyzing) [Actinopolymorpha rutila]
MCGIAGIVDRRTPRDPDALSQMLAAQRHRGPDGSGTFEDRDVGLGHCRLAVLDTSPMGRQPMSDPSGRYVCTYNGAIYNFVELRRVLERDGVRFRSTGDTEVLLAAYAAWGADCLERLNGMFAFAIYDRWSRELFCARDRLGVKPFVYVSNDQRFAFASEHKALIAAGLAARRVSPSGIYEFIGQGYVSAGGSLFEEIRSLPPGHTLHIDADRRETVREWWRPSCEPIAGRTGAEDAEVVRELLADATRLRLRSDVPVGTHLSGGLDSSAVTAAAARGGAVELATFTGAFAEPRWADERKWSRLVADGAGCRRVEIDLDVDALAEVFRRVVWHLDEPVVGPGVLPQQLVYDATARAGIKVVLAGHGGDELFGGYLRHRGLHFRQLLRHHDLRQRSAAAVELCRLAAEAGGRLTRPQTVRDADLDPGFLRSVAPEVRERARRGPGGFTSAAQLMRWDLQHYLPGLLHAEDRISMASSVESRTPLLDHRLVDFATRLPDGHHFQRGTSKPVLRHAVAPWLPRAVAHRRDKRGFPTPLERWQRQARMRDLVLDLVRPAAGRRQNSVMTVFTGEYLARPEAMTARQLWTVLLLHAWLGHLDCG